MMIGIIAAANKIGKVTPPEPAPLQKIPVVKIYNHTLTGNENALIDSNAGHSLVDGSSDQSFIPTGSNNWWDSISAYLANPVLITTDNGFSGAFRTTALPPEGINYTLRLNQLYKVTKVCIFLEPKNSGDKGHVIVKSGTPYNFTDVIADLHDNGSLGSQRWFDFDCSKDTRWVNISITDKDCGIIRDVVLYGNPIGAEDEDTWSVMEAPQAEWVSVSDKVGVNIVYGMGQDWDGTKYDEGYKGGTRTFGAGKYILTHDGELVHPSGTAGAGEQAFCQRIIASGGDQYYCIGSILCEDMAETPGDGSDWANQKPIDIALGDAINGQRLSGKLTFNEIATTPSSYARAAYLLNKLALAHKDIGIKKIEPDNEKDGSFKGAGFMYPEQLACMMSVYWDGHNNTVQYLGNNVGIKDIIPDSNIMELYSPAFSYINARYFDCMRLWFETQRTDTGFGIYPFDVLNVHAYPGTFEVQFSGNGEAINPEEVVAYNLAAKLKVARDYAYTMGEKKVANTELGFDTYYKVHPHPEAGCGAVEWGGSFVSIKSDVQDPPFNIQANWLLRSYLMHIANDIPLRIYWLAEQQKIGYGCGTFNAAGLLYFTDDHGIGVPNYLRKSSWYFIEQLKTEFEGFSFLKDVSSAITSSDGKHKAYLFIDNASQADYKLVVWWGSDNEVDNGEGGYTTMLTGSLSAVMAAAGEVGTPVPGNLYKFSQIDTSPELVGTFSDLTDRNKIYETPVFYTFSK